MAQAEPPRPRKRMRRIAACAAEDLEPQVAGLQELDVPALRANWRALFGSEPSPQIGRTLLVRALAYRLQERVLGRSQALSPADP